jgi:AraC family transcriptional regulator, regulatory protein of adaptative response / methylated-DNA-[protein]-cysteine methyltransferase
MTQTLRKPKRGGRARTSDNRRWAAVLARDRASDGTFYYAVTSTGVYCRPSCPARRPKREHVRFFATCADAEAAGYRACRRCNPMQTPLHREHAAKVAHACRLLETEQDVPSLAKLAATAGMSPYHFHRIFKSVIGVTPKAYATAQRRQRLQSSLQRSPSVTEAIYDAGFGSSSRFYAASDKSLGMTPKAFRDGGANTELQFAVGKCSLGTILVAASHKGIVAILMGDDKAALEQDLRMRFTNAAISPAEKTFKHLLAKVIAAVETPGRPHDLPLDVRGTAFQQKVWAALTEIPVGSTLSYAEMAAKIGKPNATRAVAGACAANPLAVVIPCHRVVRSDGALSGYRWGTARKRALLDRESKS